MNIQPTAPGMTTRNDERLAVTETPGTVSTAAAKANAVTTAAANNTDGSVEPTSKELKSAVDKLNQSMTASAQGLEFSVDQDSKRTVVKLVDRNTHEVLRQMPTKEALEIAKSLDKAMGKLIDSQA